MKTLALSNVEKAGVFSLVRTTEPKKSKPKIFPEPRLEFRHSVHLNFLVFISFCYLLFPIVIFVCGFARIEIAAVLAGLIICAYYRLIRETIASADFQIQAKSLSQEWHIWRWHVLLMSIFAFGWLMFSSIGGIGYRNFDSGIRSSLLWHLVTGSWPLYFESGYFGKAFGAVPDKAYVYYFAYYLPAAVAGKLLGWKVANLALFAYSWLGVSLALMLVRMYVRQRHYWVTLLVFIGICLFGGMDYVFAGLFGPTNDRSEMWLSPFHYFSHTRNLFWAPQHCVPTWLMIGIMLNQKQVSPLLMRSFPLVTVSMLLWSPLCLLGLIPFIFAMMKYHWKEWLRLSLETVLTCLLFLLLIAFIVSNDFSFKMLFAPNFIVDYWEKHCLFILSEFILLSTIIFFSNNKIEDSNFLLTAFGLLLIIPIFILGQWNDWSIKLSMPPLFVLSVFMIKQIVWLIENKNNLAWVSVFLFGICAWTPLEELAYSAKNYRISFEKPPEIREFGPNYIVWQQLGDPHSFFFRYIARRR